MLFIDPISQVAIFLLQLVFHLLDDQLLQGLPGAGPDPDVLVEWAPRDAVLDVQHVLHRDQRRIGRSQVEAIPLHALVQLRFRPDDLPHLIQIILGFHLLIIIKKSGIKCR